MKITVTVDFLSETVWEVGKVTLSNTEGKNFNWEFYTSQKYHLKTKGKERLFQAYRSWKNSSTVDPHCKKCWEVSFRQKESDAKQKPGCRQAGRSPATLHG